MRWIAFLLFCSAAQAQFVGPRAIPPIPWPVAHWRLEGAEAGIWRDSVGTNHLSPYHISGTQPITNTGKMGLAASFTTNSLSCLTNAGTNLVNLRNSNFCVACWFYPTNVQDWKQVVSKRGSVSCEWGLDVFKNGAGAMGIRWLTWDTTWRSVSLTNPAILPNVWNLILAYRDGTNWGCTLYTPANAGLCPTGIVLTTSDTNMTTLAIGNSRGGGATDEFCGRIDSVTIWKEALSRHQMNLIWNLGHGGLDFYFR